MRISRYVITSLMVLVALPVLAGAQDTTKKARPKAGAALERKGERQQNQGERMENRGERREAKGAKNVKRGEKARTGTPPVKRP